MLYGISGVCHQTANRILIPAQVRVSAARGYNLSFKTFGHYGRSWQPGWAAWLHRLANCMGAAPNPSLLVDHVGVDRQHLLGKDAAMTDDARGPLGGKGSEGPTFGQLMNYMSQDAGAVDQIRSMCNPHLERPLDHEEETALIGHQEWFESQQKTFVGSLQSGTIDRAGYLDLMNALLAKSMSRYLEVLGKTRFLLVFGEAGWEPDKLIDKNIFLGEH